MIYFLLFFFILLFGIFDFFYISKLNKLFFIYIIGLVLIVIGGLRWETGTDWYSYYDFYSRNYDYNDFVSFNFEYLFAVLAFSVKKVFNSYTILLLIISFLAVSIKLYGFVKISDYKYIFLTILMYYANQLGDVSSTRQSLALSFGVIGLLCIVNKRLILYLITTCIAFYFHTSAVIGLLAIPLFYITIERKGIIIVMVSGLCLGLFITLSGTRNFLFSYVMGGNGHIAKRLTAYQEIQELGNSSTGSAIDPKVSYILGLIRRCFVLIPALIFYKKLSYHKHFKILLSVYVLGSLIYLTFTPIIQVLNRMSAYFDISEFLILPLFVTIPVQRYIRVSIYIILIMYTFAKFYSTIMSFWTFYTPYKLCF